MTFDLDTSEKIISILGVVGTLIGYVVYRRNSDRPPLANPLSVQQSQSNNVTVTIGNSIAEHDHKRISDLKSETSILFIDDDKTFKIVGILKKMGWVNSKIIKDINSLGDHNVMSADVLFIDIQGVGRLLQLSEEGLGLALAIKRRYPEKKVIIYSAQEEGKRFHEALAEADYFLPKTAEPIQFEEAIIRVVKK